MNRRNFIKLSAYSSAALLISNRLFAETFLSESINGPFKGLVRLNLSGGHDSLNMLIPIQEDPYLEYQRIRSKLAIPKKELLPLTFNGQPSNYALHPKLPKLATLFNSGELAFVSNVGPLVAPTSKEQIENNQANLPQHLFSHNSQEQLWSSCITDLGVPQTGWAGRLADQYFQPDPQFVVGQSIGSNNLWQSGSKQQPYVFGVNGATEFTGMTTKNSQNTKQVINELNEMASRDNSPLIRVFNRMNSDAIFNSKHVNNVLSDPALVFDPSDFDSSQLGEQGMLMHQFEMLAKVILSRQQLSRTRATYSINTGGYDTHKNQNSSIDRLYAALDSSIYAFYRKMKQHGLERNITLFCSSEFGRTVSTNDSGTGHGWGGHYFVLGGSVNGGNVFGEQPSLIPESKDIVFNNRLLPTISVDQYAATMTSWLGLTEKQNIELFPNLINFPLKNIGFMKV